MSNILNHVKYKNNSTQTNTNSITVGKQTRISIIKKADVQATRPSTEVVSQRPEVCISKEEIGNDSSTVSTGSTITKPKRATKGANPNKDIIQRANKGAGHKLNSFAGLADLFTFEVEADQEANQE